MSNNNHYGGSSHNNYYTGSTTQSGGQQHGSSLGGTTHNNHTGVHGHTGSNSGHQSASSRDKEPLMASQILDRIITQQLATNSYPSAGGSTSHVSSTASGSVTAAVFGTGGAGGSNNYPATSSAGNTVGSYSVGGGTPLMSPPSHRTSHPQQQLQQAQHKSPQLPRASMPPSSYNIYEALQQPHRTVSPSINSNSGNSRNSSSSSNSSPQQQQQGMMMQQQQRNSSGLDSMKGFQSPMTSHPQANTPTSNIPSYYTSTAAAAAAYPQSSTHQQSTAQQTQQQHQQRQQAVTPSLPQTAHSSPASQSSRYSWGTQAMYSNPQQRHPMYQDQQEKVIYQQYGSQQGQDSTSQLHHNRQSH
ncbi:hypothetical protein BIW11_13427 [Tropilaelaps mercedesae]|uniref:Uncharacterized protein n=1 Tax=Tropilaelaps mercedesae TaxID=418985 RepID=A0A1V9X273_9ACAR|nr:hypothetical protein BIW11_13427 [Tropilaelaps mercedesae]